METLTSKNANQGIDTPRAPILRTGSLWLNDFLGSTYNFLVQIFTPVKRGYRWAKRMSEDKEMRNLLDAHGPAVGLIEKPFTNLNPHSQNI